MRDRARGRRGVCGGLAPACTVRREERDAHASLSKMACDVGATVDCGHERRYL